MDFRRESWRKLYVRESLDHRSWPVMARGLRDLLIRYAKDDGTLVAKTADPVGDLTRALAPHNAERETVSAAIVLLLADGYLVHSRQRLTIARFVEGQKRSKSTARVQAFRAREAAKVAEEQEDGNVPGTVSETGSNGDAEQQSETDPTRPETKRPDRKRKRPVVAIPSDWKPNEAHQKHAGKTGLAVTEEAADFRDWTTAKGVKFASWDAAFSSHLRRRAKWKAERGDSGATSATLPTPTTTPINSPMPGDDA